MQRVDGTDWSDGCRCRAALLVVEICCSGVGFAVPPLRNTRVCAITRGCGKWQKLGQFLPDSLCASRNYIWVICLSCLCWRWISRVFEGVELPIEAGFTCSVTFLLPLPFGKLPLPLGKLSVRGTYRLVRVALVKCRNLSPKHVKALKVITFSLSPSRGRRAV